MFDAAREMGEAGWAREDGLAEWKREGNGGKGVHKQAVGSRMCLVPCEGRTGRVANST